MRKQIKLTEQQYINLLQEVSYGYHSGDLGKSQSDGLYGLSRSRNTGHYGSGTYFFGNKEDAQKYGDYANRPVHEVDFDEYNLFKPQNYKDGMELHEFLKEINRDYIYYHNKLPNKDEIMDVLKELQGIKRKYDSYLNPRKITRQEFEHLIKYLKRYEPVDSSFWHFHRDDINSIVSRELSSGEYSRNEVLVHVIEYLIENLNSLIHTAWEKDSIESGSKLFTIARILNRKVEDVRNALYASRDYANSHDYRRDSKEWRKQGKPSHLLRSHIDSASTFFMKQLGYDGIDVRGIDGLDNGMYGSVIYDLK